MSNLFSTQGNTYCVAATTTSGSTLVTIPNSGQFMLDNTGTTPVFISHGIANTVVATIPTTGTATKGFWVEAGQTKWFSTHQEFNNTPYDTWYVAGITTTGNANVYITSCATY